MKLYCPECQSVYEEDLEACPVDGARLFTLENEQEDPLIDAVIDSRFRIDSLLGQGGMGAVYRGVQMSVNREVAIKVLRPELLDRELALERFYRESKIISELTHPNIVRLIDFGQDRERDLLYLVMELVNGYNLGDLLEQGRMRAALGLEIVYQVCGALTEPHSRGVIHRDLKPDNLLLVPISDGTLQVKVLDFGIARALGNNTQLTATGMVCGTPQYMAPEQAQNMDINAATDLYALGIILYEMLCGIPPFIGQNSLQVMLQHIQHIPSPLSSRMPAGALPPEIEDLVNDMLAKTPEARPTSAREVRDRIDKIRRSYDLDPVRLNPDVSRNVMFEKYLLPMMPMDGGGQTANTGLLRRETGLNKRAGSPLSTEDNLSLMDTQDAQQLTEPLGQRVEVMADGAATLQHPHNVAAATTVPEGELDSMRTVPRQPAASTPAMDTVAATKPTKRNGPLFALLGVVFLGICVASVVAVALVFQEKSNTAQPTDDKPIVKNVTTPDDNKVNADDGRQPQDHHDTPQPAIDNTTPKDTSTDDQKNNPKDDGQKPSKTTTNVGAKVNSPTKTAKTSKTNKTTKKAPKKVKTSAVATKPKDDPPKTAPKTEPKTEPTKTTPKATKIAKSEPKTSPAKTTPKKNGDLFKKAKSDKIDKASNFFNN